MKIKTRRIMLAILNTAGVAAVIIINSIANILPINGKNTGQISDQYQNYFAPAGITFSIWALIYILLIAFSIFQFIYIFKESNTKESFIEKIGLFFFITCVSNSAWIFAWHYEFLSLSLIIIVSLLISLIFIYLNLYIGKPGPAKSEIYFVHLPISVYLGWVTIATIANTTTFLVSIQWTRFGISEVAWTVIMIFIGIIISLIMLFSRRDLFYSLVVVWALIGIFIKRSHDDSNQSFVVMISAFVGIASVVLSALVQAIRGRVYR